MSAWMITNAHADFLATAYRQFVDPSIDPQEFGQQLLIENARSLRARYEDRHGVARDGEAQAATYRFKPWSGNIDPENANKQAACAEYQCCEHDGWTQSESYRQIQAIQEATAQAHEWSDFYPWGIDCHPEEGAACDPDPAPRPVLILVAQIVPEQLRIPLWQ